MPEIIALMSQILSASSISKMFSYCTFVLRIGEQMIGPWGWSSGQRARLQLRRSEFESRRSLQILFRKILFENSATKQKVKMSVGLTKF